MSNLKLVQTFRNRLIILCLFSSCNKKQCSIYLLIFEISSCYYFCFYFLLFSLFFAKIGTTVYLVLLLVCSCTQTQLLLPSITSYFFGLLNLRFRERISNLKLVQTLELDLKLFYFQRWICLFKIFSVIL